MSEADADFRIVVRLVSPAVKPITQVAPGATGTDQERFALRSPVRDDDVHPLQYIGAYTRVRADNSDDATHGKFAKS